MRQRDAFLLNAEALKRSKEVATFSELGKISSVQQMLGPLFDGEKVHYFERVFTINKRSDETVHISRKFQKSTILRWNEIVAK